MIALALLLPFQNCSQSSKEDASSGASARPTLPGGGLGNAGSCIGYFCGAYYDFPDQVGLVFEAQDAYPLDFDWGGDPPGPGMEEDTFSIYWVGTFSFEAGNYLFRTTTDDGVRILVDGVTVIDEYYDQGPTLHTAIVPMTAGNHKVEIYYYENGGGALLKADWVKQ